MHILMTFVLPGATMPSLLQSTEPNFIDPGTESDFEP